MVAFESRECEGKIHSINDCQNWTKNIDEEICCKCFQLSDTSITSLLVFTHSPLLFLLFFLLLIISPSLFHTVHCHSLAQEPLADFVFTDQLINATLYTDRAVCGTSPRWEARSRDKGLAAGHVIVACCHTTFVTSGHALILTLPGMSDGNRRISQDGRWVLS